MIGLDIVITGIPRSGTSYLCGLLNKVKNNIVINEPDRLSILLSASADPIVAADYYKMVRERVLSGKQIENKMIDGSIIEDTALRQNFEMYYPDYENEAFSLCTKNTLGYLSRLDKFPKVMPNAPIFACIRNPIDTIASWKTTFEHLKLASVAENFVIGSKKDVYLTDWQKEKVNEISKEKLVSRRRALFWTYLAEWIELNREILTIIDYNNIVLFPEETSRLILNGANRDIEFKVPVKPSSIRTGKRESLDSEDYKAIEEICQPIAEKMKIL